MKKTVFMLLDNGVASVYVKTVIKLEVVSIYYNVLYVENNIIHILNPIYTSIRKDNFYGSGVLRFF